MLKVIIADDEERVCRLIQKLVDWDALEMEIAATAANGIEALDAIEKYKPDLVITDIRMPGYDGLDMIERAKELKEDLEFIIISGYGQFEYAQRAIRYGVGEYLLKPIQKKELTETLEKLRDHILTKKGLVSREEAEEMKSLTLLEKKKKDLLSQLISEREVQDEEDYRNTFRFHGETLQVYLLQLDTEDKLTVDIRERLEEKVSLHLAEVMGEGTLTVKEVHLENKLMLILFEYPTAERELVRKGMRELFHSLKGILPLNGVEVTLGEGAAVYDIKDLYKSYETALVAVEERLVKGTGRIFLGEDIPVEHHLLRSDKVFQFFKNMEKSLSVLDYEAIQVHLKNLKETIVLNDHLTGHELIHLIKEISSHFTVMMMKNRFLMPEESEVKVEHLQRIESAYSLEELFSLVEEWIVSSVKLLLQHRSESFSGPIREVQAYLEENYMRSVTLDEMSNLTGFSPTYFSTMIKKETGKSFLEHLTEIRINKAKELLKEKDLRIMDICEMVGYSDVKHFTKSFIRYTGLKPNEYRKIYA